MSRFFILTLMVLALAFAQTEAMAQGCSNPGSDIVKTLGGQPPVPPVPPSVNPAVNGLCLEMYSNAIMGTPFPVPQPEGCESTETGMPAILASSSCVNIKNLNDCSSYDSLTTAAGWNLKPNLGEIRDYFAENEYRDQFNATLKDNFITKVDNYKSSFRQYVYDNIACVSVSPKTGCVKDVVSDFGCLDCSVAPFRPTDATSSSYTTDRANYADYAKERSLCLDVSKSSTCLSVPSLPNGDPGTPPPLPSPLNEADCDDQFPGSGDSDKLTRFVCKDLQLGYNGTRLTSIQSQDSGSIDNLIEMMAVMRGFYMDTLADSYNACVNYVQSYAGGWPPSGSPSRWTPPIYNILWGCKVMFGGASAEAGLRVDNLEADLTYILDNVLSYGLVCSCPSTAPNRPQDLDVCQACVGSGVSMFATQQ